MARTSNQVTFREFFSSSRAIFSAPAFYEGLLDGFSSPVLFFSAPPPFPPIELLMKVESDIDSAWYDVEHALRESIIMELIKIGETTEKKIRTQNNGSY